MPDLRPQAIEAMALEMCQQRGEDDHPDRPTCSFNRWLAEAALDALLDFLTETAQQELADHDAENCAETNDGCACITDTQVLRLLQSLRP